MSILHKKYKIIFLRKHFNAVFVFKVIEKDTITPIIALSEKKFSVDIGNPAYLSKNQKIYIFDVDSGSQLTFFEFASQMKPEELDMIVGQKIIKELTSGVIDNKREKIFWVLLGVLLGGLIAVVVCMGIYNDKIQTLIADYSKTVIPFITMIRGGV